MILRPLSSEESALVVEYIWMVDRSVSMLRARIPYSVDAAELQSSATQGLLAAAQNWDPSLCTFRTYAHRRIRYALLDYLRSTDWLSRGERARLRRIESTCGNADGQFPSRPISMDSVLPKTGARISDVIADENAEAAPDAMQRSEQLSNMVAALGTLEEREKKILSLYYFEGLLMREIGAIYRLTDSRISDIIKEALATLRRRLRAKDNEQRRIEKVAPVLPDARRREGTQRNRDGAVDSIRRRPGSSVRARRLPVSRLEGDRLDAPGDDPSANLHRVEYARDTGAADTDSGFLEHHIRDTNDAEYTAAMTDQTLTRDSAWWHDFRALARELEFWKSNSRTKDREIARLNSLLSPSPAQTDDVKPFVRSSRAHVAKPVMFVVAIFAACIALCGCSAFGRAGKIKIPGSSLLPGNTEVKGVADAGTPPVVNTSAEESSLPLPAGTTITETKTEAVAATENTPAKPAAIVREIKLASDTTWVERAQKIQASAGTVDTSVAKHRIDVESRRPLLYIGLALVAAALFSKSLIPAWPSITHGLLVCGGILIGAWKFAEIPWWASLIIAGLIAAKMLGYKRAEWDKNGNGIPDIIEPANKPAS